MTKIISIAVGLISSAVTITAAAYSQNDFLPKAMKGDYQAQRNLAFSYANPEKGERADPIASCAWYLVILQSGSEKVNDGDAGNVRVYCGRLQQEELIAADARAKRLLKQIYK